MSSPATFTPGSDRQPGVVVVGGFGQSQTRIGTMLSEIWYARWYATSLAEPVGVA